MKYSYSQAVVFAFVGGATLASATGGKRQPVNPYYGPPPGYYPPPPRPHYPPPPGSYPPAPVYQPPPPVRHAFPQGAQGGNPGGPHPHLVYRPPAQAALAGPPLVNALQLDLGPPAASHPQQEPATFPYVPSPNIPGTVHREQYPPRPLNAGPSTPAITANTANVPLQAPKPRLPPPRLGEWGGQSTPKPKSNSISYRKGTPHPHAGTKRGLRRRLDTRDFDLGLD